MSEKRDKLLQRYHDIISDKLDSEHQYKLKDARADYLLDEVRWLLRDLEHETEEETSERIMLKALEIMEARHSQTARAIENAMLAVASLAERVKALEGKKS